MKLLDRIPNLIIQGILLIAAFLAVYSIYDIFCIYQKAGESRSVVSQTEPPVTGQVAWLQINGTDIDYPVMQGEDNVEYLNKDPHGDYSLAGSIFLDFRNSPDCSDHYNLIYGHHMEYGYMFGALDHFFEPGYLETHKTGALVVNGTEWNIELFAALETDAEEPIIFNPLSDPEEYIQAHAGILLPTEPGGRLIGLSTCKDTSTTSRRIVFGKLSAPERG